MTTLHLTGAQVTLADPIEVGRGVGHHWFPMISQFPTGELMVSVSINPDAHKLPYGAQAIYLSDDQGRSWRRAYSVTEAASGIRIPRPNGDLLSLGGLRPDPLGQWRTFSGNYIRYQAGGRRVTVEEKGLRVTFHRDIKPYEEEKVFPEVPNKGWQVFDGNGLELDGRLLATMYMKFQGDNLYTTVVMVSEDEGHTWNHLSTVAGPDAVPGAPEGPCEPNLALLETGELMCVMRVGSGSSWNLARAYSQDGGRTWSSVDRLPAFSVEPCLLRMANGTLVLSSGRAGIYLWVSTDPRGTQWQQVDVIAHHNSRVSDPANQIVPERSEVREERHNHDQTTAYTEMVEVAPDQLLLVYDRTPFGWHPVPLDSAARSRVFVLPLTIRRTKS